MTINLADNTPRVVYSVAEGVTQTSFTVPFEFFESSDVSVYVDDTLQSEGSNYTVTGGDGSTGSITFSGGAVTGATGGSKVVLFRRVPLERTSDFNYGADINRGALNEQLDVLTAITADLKDASDRSLHVNDYEQGTNLELPTIAARKGNALAFNAVTGNPEAGPSVELIDEALNNFQGLTAFIGYDDLIANETFTYETGSVYSVSEGDTFSTTDSGLWEVAASGASDHHATTAGGVKLYEAGPNFSTRARAVAAHNRNVAAGRSMPGGTVWWWPDFSIVFMPSGHELYGTDPIYDLPGWAPNGVRKPEHIGAAKDSVTDDRYEWNLWKAIIPTGQYYVNSAVQHPDVRGTVEIDFYSDAANPFYQIESVNNTRLTGRIEQDGQGGTVRVEGDTDGLFVQNMDIVSDGFALLLKPQLSLNTPTWNQNFVIYANLVRGDADTADSGIALDGDCRNGMIFGNVVKDILRTDSGITPAHAYSCADGKDVDPSALDCSNVYFMMNVAKGIGGNAYHCEDPSPRTGFCWNVARDIETGIEITTGPGIEPKLQNYIGNMFAGASSSFVDATGTGSTRNTNYAFNIFDGDGVAMSGSYAVRINQPDTYGINYLGNIHADLDQTAFESNANGPFSVSYNVFDGITGNGIDLTRSTAVFGVSHNQFRDISGYAISGSSVASYSPATLRGVLVESNNAFESVTSGIVDKANSANIQGDRIFMSPELVANVASDDVMFIAPRDGWVTSVSRVATNAPTGGGSAIFTIYKTNSGGSTKIIDNSILATGSQYDTYLWGSENPQIEENSFSRGDVIRIVCSGASANANKAIIQLECFFHD